MPRESRDRPWVVIFILLSLLAHLLFVLLIVLVSLYLPKPKLKDTNPPLTSVTLSLQPTPAPPATPPPQKRTFIPTTPDQQAKHQVTPIESDNDTRLRSKSQVARAPDSLMPDIDVKHQHAANLRDAPNAPSKEPPHPAQPSSPGQKTAHQTLKNTPQNQNQQAQSQQPTPADVAKQKAATPTKTKAAKVEQQQLDANGLPVLPPIAAPTLAAASPAQESVPASSMQETSEDSHGAIGSHGDNSPAAMATELGRYKAKVYRAVGQLWYQKVDRQFQVLPVGLVHIQFTIHKDGSVETKVLDGDQGSMQLLLSISLNSIVEAAPFDPFTDTMIRDVGDSYTDDFTFSIYGGGN